MKKLITFLFLAGSYAFGVAQSTDSEKYDFPWQHSPVFKQPTLKSFSTNNGYLELKGMPKQSGADVVLTGAVLPAVSIQSPEITSISNPNPPGYSQIFWVEVKTSDNKILFYRVYNEFGEAGPSRPVEAGKPISDPMFFFNQMTRTISPLFASFKYNEDVKLHFVKKSTQHDDINQGYNLVAAAARMIAADSIVPAKQNMEKAVTLWSEALNQSDYKDKSARINKKITEILYKNLIPTLIMLNWFDEASALIKKSESELGVFYSVFTSTQQYFMKKKKLTLLASGSDPVKLMDIETPKDIQLITSATKLSVPDLANIRKILPGTWRTVAVSTSMPGAGDPFPNTPESKKDCWHFLPDGKIFFENEKTDPFQHFQLENYVWDARKATNGKSYFVTAPTVEDLKDQSRFADNKPFEIVHMSLNSMLVKFENSNPNVDVSFYYYQLERVKPIL